MLLGTAAASLFGLALPVRFGIAEDAGFLSPARRSYAALVGGLPMAEADLAVQGSGDGVESRLRITPAGVAALFGGTVYRMEAASRLARGRVVPISFDWLQEKRDRTRKVAIRYDGEGEIASFEYINNGRSQPSEVPDDLHAGTMDPLSAFLSIPVWLGGIEPGGTGAELAIPVFDGRKRFDLAARHLGRAGAESGDHHVEVRLIARHGFERDDAFVTFPDDDPAPALHARFAEGPPGLPLRIEGVNTRLPVAITPA
jgi:hypothetical protein